MLSNWPIRSDSASFSTARVIMGVQSATLLLSCPSRMPAFSDPVQVSNGMILSSLISNKYNYFGV